MRIAGRTSLVEAVRSDSCDVCQGTGLDLPQNFYPPFEPALAADLSGDMGQYCVNSEEMLPPDGFTALLRRWEARDPDVRYIWATPRRLAALWQPLAAVDKPVGGQIASRVENNPVQTGCYVSRIRIKQEARRCEAQFYGWETALALSCPQAMDPAAWEAAFLELPLFFFHDAVTGTHQDEAYAELMDRMAAMRRTVNGEAERTLQRAGWRDAQVPAPAAANTLVQAFAPCFAGSALRVPLASVPWRLVQPLVAVAADGRRWPVVYECHAWSPPIPSAPGRLIDAVGPSARTRPDECHATIEIGDPAALQWQTLRLEPAAAPRTLAGTELRNASLTVELGDHGVAAIHDARTGAVARLDDLASVGGLVIEEDVGDPWGTRRQSTFRRSLTPFTRRLGALRHDGYSEAYYAGRYEPNLPFGREEDPEIFALEWYITVRLLDDARRVDFEYEVFWKSENRRVRAVFPVQAESDAAWYSIPGGWLERARYDQTETHLWSPAGDWPALHFVAAQPAAKQSAGWAVVNYGTPSARVADGRIMLSRLRSPGFGHCLERYAQNYPMPTSGLRDGGWRHFTLSCMPHGGAADLPRLAAEAAALNLAVPAASASGGARLPGAPFQAEGEGLQLVAAKLPFGGGPGRIVRLLNLNAASSCAVLQGVEGPKAWKDPVCRSPRRG